MALRGMRQAFGCKARPGRARCCRRAVATHAASAAPKVLLTREAGKNEKLRAALSTRGFQCIELPLIEHAAGPDRARLPELLRSQPFDWVAVTSPEAAAVFLEGWAEAGRPQVRVAVVGGDTGEVLQAAGVQPAYTASKALGKVMGSELPKVPGGANTVLYPASAKASTDLQDSLAAAGFTVTRINTYNTSSVRSVPEPLLREALGVDVVTYGSPSAVKAWVGLAGLDTANSKVNACIGSTSARACASAGITQHVFYPEAPGIDGWVDAVVRGCREANVPLPEAAAV